MKIIRQREAVKEQQGHLYGDGSKGNPIMVDELRRERGRSGPPRKPTQHNRGKGKTPAGAARPGSRRQCKPCGGKEHTLLFRGCEVNTDPELS